MSFRLQNSIVAILHFCMKLSLGATVISSCKQPLGLLSSRMALRTTTVIHEIRQIYCNYSSGKNLILAVQNYACNVSLNVTFAGYSLKRWIFFLRLVIIIARYARF